MTVPPHRGNVKAIEVLKNKAKAREVGDLVLRYFEFFRELFDKFTLSSPEESSIHMDGFEELLHRTRVLDYARLKSSQVEGIMIASNVDRMREAMRRNSGRSPGKALMVRRGVVLAGCR